MTSIQNSLIGAGSLGSMYLSILDDDKAVQLEARKV